MEVSYMYYINLVLNTLSGVRFIFIDRAIKRQFSKANFLSSDV